MTVMTPYPIVYLVTAGALWCKNTQSITFKHYQPWRSKCFPHRYPEPACKCHFKTKTTFLPHFRGDQWKAESIKYTFSYSALEDLYLGRRDAGIKGHDVCKLRKLKIKAFVWRA